MDAEMIALDSDEKSRIELDLLLEAIYRLYQHDFRGYARSSLFRGVARAQSALGSPTITALLDRIAHDSSAFEVLLRHLTIRVSDLFRDPGYFRLLRELIAPHLATYPSLRIWVAGCGTGEEAYSIAIILHEVGLLARSRIYATDIDLDAMATARAGAYEISRMERFDENYRRAGGCASLDDYFYLCGSQAIVAPFLQDRILFSDHSLATDSSFVEAQLISCRNVLIYFDRRLQDRCVDLFRDSLCPRGFLGLGSRESLSVSGHARFEILSRDEQLYRVR